MQFDLTFLIILGLALLIFGGLFYGLFYNSIQNQKKSTKRMKAMQVDRKTKVKNQSKKMDEKARRKMREETLKNVEAQSKAEREASNPPLSAKFAQAGLDITMKTFIVYSMIAGGVSFVAAFLFIPGPVYIPIAVAFVAGFGLPRWVISFLRNRRFKKFTLAFPNSIDIIVRGIKSGLPLNDCIRIIAKDAEEPVRTEFRKMIEATQLGLTTPEAAQRLYQSVPTSETNFFAIVLAIQSSAGGNLSEALGNLSNVLRERKKMADKIQAVSMEAKASGVIIGSLPFVVALLVNFTTPGYLSALWTTTQGQKVLGACALGMCMGVAIMKKMINFKF